MIEKVIYDYLSEKLDPTKVFMEIPTAPPARCVVVEKTGGRKREHICNSTFAIQSYEDSMYHAAVLNEEVKAVMEQAIELDEIVSVQLNSDYNYTDTTTKRHRYQAVFDITHY